MRKEVMIVQRHANLRCLIAAVALGAAVLSGCSSSSDGTPGPSKTSAADHSETFHNVSERANRLIQRNLPLMRGVATNTYQAGDLTVTFRPTAVKLDQTNVENVVRQAKQQAATKQAKDNKKSKK
jgi:TolA-binding protein